VFDKGENEKYREPAELAEKQPWIKKGALKGYMTAEAFRSNRE